MEGGASRDRLPRAMLSVQPCRFAPPVASFSLRSSCEPEPLECVFIGICLQPGIIVGLGESALRQPEFHRLQALQGFQMLVSAYDALGAIARCFVKTTDAAVWKGGSRISFYVRRLAIPIKIPTPITTARVTSGRFLVWVATRSSALLPILVPILTASFPKLASTATRWPRPNRSIISLKRGRSRRQFDFPPWSRVPPRVGRRFDRLFVRLCPVPFRWRGGGRRWRRYEGQILSSDTETSVLSCTEPSFRIGLYGS
jgi:hypothetical protein